MGSVKVPRTWSIHVEFRTSTGRVLSADVEGYGDTFEDAMDSLPDSELEAAGLGSEARHKDLAPNEELTHVAFQAVRL